MSPLISFIAKVFLASALGLAAGGLVRRQCAAVRHAVLTAMFGLLLLLPFVAWLAPPLRVGLLPVSAPPAALVQISPVAGALAPSSRPAAAVSVTADWAPHPSSATGLLLLWIGGALVLLLPLLAGLVESRRLRRGGRSWDATRRHAAELAQAAGIRRPVDVLLHAAISGPMTCGTLRPAVLLPTGAGGWDAGDLERALIHELEHIRRADGFTRCLARAVCALYWFNPLVWKARRMMALEAERACDDAVLRGFDPITYASQLVRLARHMAPATRAAHLAMTGHSDLGRRVRALLDPRQPRGRTGTLTMTCAAITAAILALVIAPATLARAQTNPAQAVPATASALSAFDAVSVKPFKPPTGRGWHRLPQVDPRRLYIEGMTLHDMLLYAYDIGNNQLTGLPDWAVRTFFSVTGVTEKPASPDQMRLMLQRVLAQRFRFAFTETDTAQPVHALVIAPGGPKMKPWASAADCQSAVYSIDRQQAPKLSGYVLVSFVSCSIPALITKFNGNGRPADGLPVIDRTGLTGLYPMWVWQRFGGVHHLPNGRDHWDYEETFPEAVERELGLELVKTTAPYRVLHTKTITPPASN